jgi:hypothetical protein
MFVFASFRRCWSFGKSNYVSPHLELSIERMNILDYLFNILKRLIVLYE